MSRRLALPPGLMRPAAGQDRPLSRKGKIDLASIISGHKGRLVPSETPVAKAQFHRNQKVWVSTVGTWAVIEKIVPIWTRGFGEPVRITYDVGLGREFRAEELQA